MNKSQTLYHVAAVYLLYIVYTLLKQFYDGTIVNVVLSIIAIIVFSAAACFILIFAYRQSRKNKQTKLDDSDQSE